jgi:L-alanine-DL-glutamate epimerase-like enolase superfamily enzyme
MKRRDFLFSSIVLPAVAQTLRNLRITGVKVIVTNPSRGALGNYVLVKIETNQDGLHGWGDSTCSGSELAVAKFLEESMAPA